MTDSERPAARRTRAVIVAGHRGDSTFALEHAADAVADVRVAALGALERTEGLTDQLIIDAFVDPDPAVRRTAARLAGKRRGISLAVVLDDPDPSVTEVAAWACGEQEQVDDAVLDRLIELAIHADDELVRESAAAALGAIGDERGVPAILAACNDKPHVRRRAVLALAPFNGPNVEAAIDTALKDRDWQVRQAAEDLRRASGEHDV